MNNQAQQNMVQKPLSGQVLFGEPAKGLHVQENPIGTTTVEQEMTPIFIKMKNQQGIQINCVPLTGQEQTNKQIVNTYGLHVGYNGVNSMLNGSTKISKSPQSSKSQLYQQIPIINNRAVRQEGQQDLSVNFQICNTQNKQDQDKNDQDCLRIDETERLGCPENRIIPNKSTCSCENSKLCLGLTILIIAGVVLLMFVGSFWLLLVGAVLYYLECCFTNFLSLFDQVIPEESFCNMYKQALSEEPQITFKGMAFAMVPNPNKLQQIKKKQSSAPSKDQKTPALHQNTAPLQSAISLGQTSLAPQKQVPSAISLNPNINPLQPAVVPPQNDNNLVASQQKQLLKEDTEDKVRELMFSEQRSFDISSHKDYSHPLHTVLECFQTRGLLRIQPVLYWKCGNIHTLEEYRKMQAEVLAQAKLRSNDIEKCEITSLYQFQDNNFIVKTQSKASPLFFDKISFILFSVLFLSFPYRIYYLNSIRTLQLHFSKKVYYT